MTFTDRISTPTSCSYTETAHHRQREQHNVDGEATDMVTKDPSALIIRV